MTTTTYIKDAVAAVAEELLDRLTGAGRAPRALSEREAARLGEMRGRIHQLNRSAGGVPKLPVAEAALTRNGLEGDRQKQTTIHGGPERALSLFALEVIERLRAEGHPISPGSTGENVTVAGLDWSLLSPGTRLALGGEAVVEITSYANPCGVIRASFTAGQFKHISQKVNPGTSRLYARVIRPGLLAAGQEVRVLAAEAQAEGAA
jgi:MOSC domain-containing protein YiiM